MEYQRYILPKYIINQLLFLFAYFYFFFFIKNYISTFLYKILEEKSRQNIFWKSY